jgi:hypothetical protein
MCMEKCTIKFAFFVLLILLSLSFNDCEKEVEPPDLQYKLVQSFLDSKEFCKNESLFNSYGTIGRGTIENVFVDSSQVQYLMVPIVKLNRVVAYIQALMLPEDCLPNKEIWAMNFVDLSKFDNSSLTGSVKMYDLNLDGFLHSEMKVKSNKITSWECFDPPKYIYLKYDLGSKGKVEEFFACYRAVRDYQNSIDILYFICDWAPLSCAMSATAYCLYHSFDYQN